MCEFLVSLVFIKARSLAPLTPVKCFPDQLSDPIDLLVVYRKSLLAARPRFGCAIIGRGLGMGPEQAIVVELGQV